MREANFDTVFDDTKNDEREPSSQGFSASMSGLNLFDIVQMECFSRSERTIRVTSGHDIGYLFFANGSLTHAMTPDARGDEAALKILNWHDGSLEQCALGADDKAKVSLPWQELLLRAAQIADESQRKVVAFPRKRGQSGTLPKPSSATAPPPPPARASERDGVIGAARVQASGELLSVRGDSAKLPGLAAYAMRLCDLAGDALGMGRARAIDARMEHTRSVVKNEANGCMTVVLASSRSQKGELPTTGVDWNTSEPDVVRLLAGLRDVDGVFGSFLIAPSGAATGVDLPNVFDREVVADAATRVARMRDAFEDLGDPVRALDLRFAEQRLYVRCVDGGFLASLLGNHVNAPLLSMATSVVVRKLAVPAYNVPQPAPPRRQGRAVPGATAPGNTARGGHAPGAPTATGARPKRPVYFRGRKVSSD